MYCKRVSKIKGEHQRYMRLKQKYDFNG